MEPEPIGEVTHFYDKLSVAIVKFNKSVSVGDTIQIKGAHTDFSQKIDSMQFEHQDIQTAKRGQEVGIKVKERVREGDKVFGV